MNRPSTKANWRPTSSLAQPPGQIRAPDGAKLPTAMRRLYSGDAYAEVEVDPATLADEAEQHASTVDEVMWIDVDGLGDPADLRALGQKLKLHPLALEDASSHHQRPKLETYENHVFLVTRGPVATGEGTVQLSMFVGEGWLLTVHEGGGHLLAPVVERLHKGIGRIRKRGSDYLAFAIIDMVLDHFFPLIDDKNDALEVIEASLVDKARSKAQDIHKLRAEFNSLRRLLVSTREGLFALSRLDDRDATSETTLFLRDSIDHCSQLLDAVDAGRERCSSLMELHFSLQNARMNETMKVLTIIATIFIPLSFLAGLYGMNFDTSVSAFNLPELKSPYGYPILLSVMGAVVVGFLIYFKRKGWLDPE